MRLVVFSRAIGGAVAHNWVVLRASNTQLMADQEFESGAFAQGPPSTSFCVPALVCPKVIAASGWARRTVGHDGRINLAGTVFAPFRADSWHEEA